MIHLLPISLALLLALTDTSGGVREMAGERIEFQCDTFVPGSQSDIVWDGPTVMGDGVSITQRRLSYMIVSTLVIDSVSARDAGVYTCSHETNSLNSFELTVIEIPHFNSEMRTTYQVSVGEPVTIPCQVEACSRENDCNVYWVRNHTSSIIRNESAVTITRELILQNIQERDAGEYICAFETTNTQSKLRFYVTVIPVEQRKPKLNKSIEYIYKEVNYPEQIVLQCPIVSGENTTHNPLVITWTFTNSFKQPQHEVVDELRIEENYSRGIYKCTASNSLGSDSLGIFVEVNAPPLPKVVELTPVTLVEGTRRAVLKFETPTSPIALHRLTHLWEVLEGDNWSPINGTDRFAVTHRGHLRIMNVTLSDAGLYRVNISNRFGHSLQTKLVHVSPSEP